MSDLFDEPRRSTAESEEPAAHQERRSVSAQAADFGVGKLVVIGIAAMALFAGVAAWTYDSSRAAPATVNPGGVTQDASASAEWWPAGFQLSPSDPDVAWQWTNTGTCDELATSCWQVTVTVDAECSGVYGEVSVREGNTVLDFANDTLGGISPGQTGLLDLEWYTTQEFSGSFTGRLTQLDCL